MSEFFINLKARSINAGRSLFIEEELNQVRAFFRKHQDAQPTPLRQLSALAEKLRLQNVLVKDESARMGLGSFKILGVSYAVGRLLSEGILRKDAVLACATEGNHGRAVARTAKTNNLKAKIYVAEDMSPARIKTLNDEGAEVTIVNGNYDEAVRRCAADAEQFGWQIISDTSWSGYEEVPRQIMTGYTELMEEASAQWGQNPPDVVFVQAGVGGLAGAAASWLCLRYGEKRPYTIVCEPDSAACLLESARAGHPVSLRGSFDTIMAGLRCGEVSPLAWNFIADAADAFITVSDERCVEAMRLLARPKMNDSVITAGASGACGLAGLLTVMQNERFSSIRDYCQINWQSRVFVINTEGATDPNLYARIIG